MERNIGIQRHKKPILEDKWESSPTFGGFVSKKFGSFENELNYSVIRGFKNCDPELYSLLTLLNKHGVHTVLSCSGHGKSDPYIVVATYVSEDKIKQEISNLFSSSHYKILNWESKLGVKLLKISIDLSYADEFGISLDK